MSDLDKAHERIARSLGQRIKKEDRNLARQFAFAMNDISLLLGEVFKKYEQDGILTYEEMATYNRLSAMFEDIDAVLSKNYTELYRLIYQALGFTYQETYNLMAWSIENTAAADVGFGVATSAQVAAAVTAPIAGLTLADHLEANRQQVIKKVRNKIVVGLTEGKTYTGMIQDMQQVFDGDYKKAARVVRTESHRVMEAGKLDTAEYADQNGIRMMKKWNSVRDERVRKRPKDKADHKMLDGVQVGMDENFRGLLGTGPGPGHLHHPGEDINCRCFLTYEIAHIEIEAPDTYKRVALDRWKEIKQGTIQT